MSLSDILKSIATEDVAILLKKDQEYGSSWKRRGGSGAFHQGIARKWDRLEQQVKNYHYDIFEAIKADMRPEGILDDIQDLRRYLMLLESEVRSWTEFNKPTFEKPRNGTEHPAPFGYTPEETE